MSLSLKEVVRKHVEEGVATPWIIGELKGRLSPASVRKYVSDFKKERDPSTRRDRTERKTVSSVHISIGAKLNYFRARTGLDPQQFSNQYEFANRHLIREMELGYYDFHLTDLLKIATILNVSIEDLLQQPKVVL